jgi:hypothetical protein
VIFRIFSKCNVFFKWNCNQGYGGYYLTTFHSDQKLISLSLLIPF